MRNDATMQRYAIFIYNFIRHINSHSRKPKIYNKNIQYKKIISKSVTTVAIVHNVHESLS